MVNQSTLNRSCPRRRVRSIYLSLEKIKFVGFPCPFLMVVGRVLLFSNVGPLFCEFSVQLYKLDLVFWGFVIRKYCVDWALRLAKSAIDTLVWMDNKEVWSLVEAINWTHLDAVCVFAFDAVFSNDKGQLIISCELDFFGI